MAKMTKDLLKFFTYFTQPVRLNKALKDRTHRVPLGRRYPEKANEYVIVGKLYIYQNVMHT